MSLKTDVKRWSIPDICLGTEAIAPAISPQLKVEVHLCSEGGQPMSDPVKLSLEQEFNLNKFASQVKHLSPQQAKELLVELNRQMMVKDNLYRDILKKAWSIDSPPPMSA